MNTISTIARGVLIALAALLTGAASPAQDVSVKAQLTSGVLKLGGNVVLVIEVENAQNARVGDMPRVEGLRFGALSRPSSNFSRVIVNGRLRESSSVRWTVPIVAERAGDYTIPPIEVRVGSELLRTRSLALTAVADLRGQELLTIQLEPSTRELVEGQVVTLELLFGWDMGLNNQIGGLDLSLPWWNDLPGVLDVEEEGRGLRSRQYELSVNRDDKALVEEVGVRQVRGRDFRLFRLSKQLIPTRPGDLAFGQSYLRFVQVVERGRRDMFGFGSRDKTENLLVGTPEFSISVAPLPEEGRPFDFSGAVGSYEVRAEVDRRDVDAGESIKLTVEWSGAGNFEFFEVPDLARLPVFADFRVYGYKEEKGADHRIATFDLAPASDAVREIPPVPLSVFDPALGAYTHVASPAIPIRVRGLAGADGLAPLAAEEGHARDIRDIATDAPGNGMTRAPGPLLIGGLFVALPLAWLFLRAAVRRRGDPGAPLERRRRAAPRRLGAALRSAARADDQLRALLGFLAARTREPDQAWVGRDVEAFLGERGAAAEETRRLAELVAQLEREAYSGADRPVDAADVRRAARALVKGGL